MKSDAQHSYRVEQPFLAPDVEVGVLLPGERGGGQVLGRGAGANRVGVLDASPPPRREDRWPTPAGIASAPR